LLSFFAEIIGEKKFQSKKILKKYTKFSFFPHVVFLIEVLRLKFKYDFVENFMALLLQKEFVLGDLRNRSY
jgi:hypothetical protein